MTSELGRQARSGPRWLAWSIFAFAVAWVVAGSAMLLLASRNALLGHRVGAVRAAAIDGLVLRGRIGGRSPAAPGRLRMADARDRRDLEHGGEPAGGRELDRRMALGRGMGPSLRIDGDPPPASAPERARPVSSLAMGLSAVDHRDRDHGRGLPVRPRGAGKPDRERGARRHRLPGHRPARGLRRALHRIAGDPRQESWGRRAPSDPVDRRGGVGVPGRLDRGPAGASVCRDAGRGAPSSSASCDDETGVPARRSTAGRRLEVRRAHSGTLEQPGDQ